MLLSTGCAKLQQDREFDTTEHALSFELESSETPSRLTAAIQAVSSDTTLSVELTMSNDDTEYVSEPIHLETGQYTISSIAVYDEHDTTLYSGSDISVTLEADATVPLD